MAYPLLLFSCDENSFNRVSSNPLVFLLVLKGLSLLFDASIIMVTFVALLALCLVLMTSLNLSSLLSSSDKSMIGEIVLQNTFVLEPNLISPGVVFLMFSGLNFKITYIFNPFEAVII